MPAPALPFILINATRVHVDLSDASRPTWSTTECCPVCDADIEQVGTYDAAKDSIVCVCGERFLVRQA